MSSRSGFTFIELLIATFIIGTVVTGIFGLFVLSLRTGQEGERRVVAVALANERAEMIRNLPYQNVGTVGGIPAGSIAQQETILRNAVTYTIKTDIRYVDDPYDGTLGSSPSPSPSVSPSPPDLVNTDYKQARVEVSWTGPHPAKPILLILYLAPQGIEGGQSAGTLVFQALNAGGAAVDGATVQLQNSSVSPAVNITTQTDNAGQVILPGLPPAVGTYVLAVSKNGYTSEQTYSSTANFTPDIDHVHLNMLIGQLTPKTFVIDHVASLAITTENDSHTALGTIAYHLKGSKTIGKDATNQPVYMADIQDITDAAGHDTQANLVWDAYDFSIDGVVSGYDIKETSRVLPLVINPADNLDVTVTLVPHTPFSLHVTVVDAVGVPVNNATVSLIGNSVTQALGTGVYGQVLFSALPVNGDYTITIDAPGFSQLIQTVPVVNTTRTKLTLTAL